ncbi:hypothetical protein [Mycoplasma todarodis]|uniref:hypothetical protein n=1 Tax=Mycoplasma todarodis TaxID=1937191 RepID=UPI003B2B8C9A
MKRVEQLISKEEYISKVKPLLKDEVVEGIKNAEPLLPKNYKRISNPWYLIVSILLIILGSGTILGVLIFFFKKDSHDNSYNDPYTANNPYASSTKANEGLQIPELIFMIIGGILILAGIIMWFHRRKILKKIDFIYRNSMNNQAIYKIAVEAFPNFKLTDVEEGLSSELYEYKFNIPSDGAVVQSSPVFHAMYKDKYHVKFQSARYHWVRVVRTKNGTTTRHYYRNSGYILIEGDKKNSDYLYSMNNTSLGSVLKKIELENKEFLKTTKYRSNNEIKSRMAFTPLAMEEVSKHYKTIQSDFKLIKERWHYAFTLSTDIGRYIIDAKMGKTDEETAENYLEDIVDDFYKFYEVIGLALIPPML